MKVLKVDSDKHSHKTYAVNIALQWVRKGWIVWVEETEDGWYRVCKGARVFDLNDFFEED